MSGLQVGVPEGTGAGVGAGSGIGDGRGVGFGAGGGGVTDTLGGVPPPGGLTGPGAGPGSHWSAGALPLFTG